MRQCGLSRTRSWEPFGAEDREVIADAGTAFLQPTPWKIAYASLKLPSWTPHPGGAPMRRAAINLRKVGNEYWQPGDRTARMAASFWEDW
jgi:hypothetical protein